MTEPNLSDERIDRLLADVDDYCRLPLYDASFRARAREKVRGILSEGTASLVAENERLKTVMVAAAEEISAHWDAHCDADGYGPVNLQRRLEQGIPSEYGYTAGRFRELTEEVDSLRTQLAEAQKDAQRWRTVEAHASAAQLRWNKSPNTPGSVTVTIKFDKRYGVGPGFAQFIDEAAALTPKEQP